VHLHAGNRKGCHERGSLRSSTGRGMAASRRAIR
jgi:hypothetical protein